MRTSTVKYLCEMKSMAVDGSIETMPRANIVLTSPCNAFYHESESAKDPIKKRVKDRKIKKEEPWYTHLKNCRFISGSLSYRA